MVLSILDNVLLGLIKKIRGETFEERIENIGFFFFYSGIGLAFFGSVLMLAPIFIGITFALSNTINAEPSWAELSWVDSFTKNDLLQGIANFVIAGVSVLILGFLLKKYLKGIIKKHAYIESTNVEEKEIYTPDSEVDVSVYAETFCAEKTLVSAKEPFSNEKLNSFKDRKIFIEASKEGETKVVYGGKAEVVLTNEDEITSLNVPEEEALVYKIERVLLTKEIIHRVCDFIKEETTTLRTKIFLSASVDESMMKKFKNQEELDNLLTL